MIQEIKARDHNPLPEDHDTSDQAGERTSAKTDLDDSRSRGHGVQHCIWEFLHKLEGFHTRYTIKTAVVTSLLSVPAWLPQSRGWWNEYKLGGQLSWLGSRCILGMDSEAPSPHSGTDRRRVGGNAVDLLSRSAAAAGGAVWSGISFAAGNGSPYVMAVFAALYMLPMLYVFTQSSSAVSWAGSNVNSGCRLTTLSGPEWLAAYLL